MKLTGRRKSDNVEDVRRLGGAKTVAAGGAGAIIVALIVMFMGGDPKDVQRLVGQQMQGGATTEYVPTAEEEELAEFSSVILASTEDVWTEIFRQQGKTYAAPKLVLFHGSVQSGCGGATATSGPFYCPADQKVYIDLSFFSEMKKMLGVGGDFAYAYVIAHEVGHHIQYLNGNLAAYHQKARAVSKQEANALSVKNELEADYYAGVWAHHEKKRFASIGDDDIRRGLETAAAIGDDTLGHKEETFTHGSAADRMAALKRGIETGLYTN